MIGFATVSAQTTYYVDGTCGDDAWSGLSEVCAAPDGPKRRIGQATAIAGPGDTVLVAPGTYALESNHFGIYRPMTIRASGGPFVTVLDGEYENWNISVFDFAGGPGVIEGFTYPGEGNIDADPLFADPASGDLRLSPGSPCIDADSNPAVPEWVRLDIAGLERFVDDPATTDTGLGDPPIVDMGAHEFQIVCYPDFTGDGALDLFDFLAYVNAFNEGDLEADCTGDGLLNLFDFLCFVNAFNVGC